ncbi:MAG TPA: RAMP superfamily CRISPR-associated protein [Blastocatellia bacterium]|nr:RAMP superfamily CRISPR-associated protein [Blastocatellia bacterium]
MAIKLSSLSNKKFESDYEIKAVLSTGVSIGGAGVGSTLADKPVVKDAFDRFIIPGSHLKGRLRHECEKLVRALGEEVCESPRAESMCPQLAGLPEENKSRIKKVGGICPVCKLFGNPAIPSAILVSDLVWEERWTTETIRNRVAINRRRGTAEDRRLFFIETTPTGVELEFKGRLFVLRALEPQERKLVAAGLAQINALGGGKSGGSGWLRLSCEQLIRA